MKLEQLGIILIAIILTTSLSGYVVSFVLGLLGERPVADPVVPPDPAKQRLGVLIGKLENIIIVLIIAGGSITALALIFTAKSLMRKDEMQRDPEYYMLGTLANFAFSFAMGMLTWAIASQYGGPIRLS